MPEDEDWPVLDQYFGGISSGNDYTPLMTQAEKAKLRKKLQEIEAKRIEPGFYMGLRPKKT